MSKDTKVHLPEQSPPKRTHIPYNTLMQKRTSLGKGLLCMQHFLYAHTVTKNRIEFNTLRNGHA